MSATDGFRNRLALVLGTIAALGAPSAAAELGSRIARVGGTRVEYKIVLPDGYDPAREYPAVLVMGGGPQTMDTVDRTLDRNFRAEAEKRGYIVVAPAAPDGDLFFQGGDRIFPAFLDAILASHKIAGGKFHVAGPSNGGIAAMHVAAAHPDYFVSATAFPGYVWQPSPAKLAKLEGVCVFLYVGEHDEYRWHDEMAREAQYLQARGSLARYTLEEGQGHRLETLQGDNASRLFADFATAHQGCKR